MPSMPSAVPELTSPIAGENGHVRDQGRVHDEVEQIARVVVGPTRVNLLGEGASPALGDNISVIHAAFAAYGPGIYTLPGFEATDSYLINSQLQIPTKTLLTGPGRADTPAIKAGASFPVDTPLTRLGDGTGGQRVFGARIEHVTLDCNGVTDSTGVYSTAANEQSGVDHCLITRWRKRGVFADAGLNSQFGISNCEITPSPLGSSSHGVHFKDCLQENYIEHVTSMANVGGGTHSGNGIEIENCRANVIVGHYEGFTNGVRFSGAAPGGVVLGVDGHNTTTNVVKIDAAVPKTARIILISIGTGGSTYALSDDRYSQDLTSVHVASGTLRLNQKTSWITDSAANFMLELLTSGVANPRWQLWGSGRMDWGGGAGAVDVSLERKVANVLGLAAGDVFRHDSGATGSRPSAGSVGAGAEWYDTTLGIPIWSNGTVWKDAAGTTV